MGMTDFSAVAPGDAVEEVIAMSPDALGHDAGEAQVDAAIRDVRTRALEYAVELGPIEIAADHAGRCCRLTSRVIARGPLLRQGFGGQARGDMTATGTDLAEADPADLAGEVASGEEDAGGSQ